MMVVHFFDNIRFQYFRNALAYPITARVGVFTCEVHELQIICTDRRIYGRKHWLGIDGITRTQRIEKMRRDAVTQSARAEMHADPNAVFLIGEYIHIVVSASDGAELRARF